MLAASGLPEATVSAFMNAFAEALSDGGANSDLVWSTNFNDALRARQIAREREVAERVQRMESGEAEADMLREALGGAEASGRIEEVKRDTDGQRPVDVMDDKEDDEVDEEGDEEDPSPRVWEVPLTAEQEAMLAALPVKEVKA